MRRLMRMLPMFALLGFLAFPALAAAKVKCDVSATDMDFGAPADLSEPVETVTRVEVSCRNQKKDPASSVQVCLAIDSGFQPEFDSFLWLFSFRYGIYADAAHQMPAQSPDYLMKGLSLGSDGSSATIAFHLHGLLPRHLYWREGDYQQQVPATISWSTLPGTCDTAASEGSRSFNFQARVHLYGSCRVETSDLNFGTHYDLQNDGPITSTAQVQVACALGEQYAVHLDGGISGNILGRHMTNGVDFIDYQLYVDSTGQVWGNGKTGAEVTGTGRGLNAATTHVVRGTVPQQATPPVGTYSDTIVVTVEY